MLATAVAMMVLMLRETLLTLYEDVVDVTYAADFLHWTNTFPAISLCLARGYGVSDLQRVAGEDLERRGQPKPKAYMLFPYIIYGIHITNSKSTTCRFPDSIAT